MDVFRPTAGSTGRPDSVRDVLREAFISGLAVVVPMLVTLIVLTIAGRAVYNYLSLFSAYLPQFPPIEVLPGIVVVSTDLLIELLIPVVLLCLILIVGLFVNSSRYGERAVDWFDYIIASIPGVGSVYDSFRQMSDVMLESDTQNFREVKLVEFPHEGAYTLGFVTTETPEQLRVSAGHEEMLTLFLPLAPNPVMGGHLVHMPAEKVMDVDLTVEEGIRAVVTSGVAVPDEVTEDAGLSRKELRELGGEYPEQQSGPSPDAPDRRQRGRVSADRRRRYEAAVSPEQASTPADLARRENDDDEDPRDPGISSATERGRRDASDESDATPPEGPDAGTSQNSVATTPSDVADPDRDSTGDAADRESTDRTPADLESTTDVSISDATTPADVELDTSRERTEQTPADLEAQRRDGRQGTVGDGLGEVAGDERDPESGTDRRDSESDTDRRDSESDTDRRESGSEADGPGSEREIDRDETDDGDG